MKPTVAACLAASGALVAAALATLAPAGVAGAGEVAAAAPIERAATSLEFGSCAEFSAGADECGYLTVPLNWSKPDGKQIRIAVSRVKASVPAAQYQGVLLVNPGGPGASGLGFAALQGAIPDNAGEAYDFIGFDPRGVGDSKPAISCDPDYESGLRPNYVPVHRGSALSNGSNPALTANEKQWLARSKAYAKACGKKHGALLKNMRTIDWVRDMEALRKALGVEQINYFGFSYGTYLGQVYATKYPDRVRRMVFDGNVDPRNVWYDAQLSQDRAFERSADAFFAWVAKHASIYDLGATAGAVRTKYFDVIADLTTERQQNVGANEWTDVFVRAMYAEFLWSDAAGAFADWVHNKDMDRMRVAFEAGKEGDDNLFAVYNAVQCTDQKWPRSYKKKWRPDAFRTAAKAPLLTWSNVWFNTACLYWPAKAGKPVKVDGSQVPPVLVINATLDGATPYSGALEVRKRFPRSVLIAEEGATTHSGSLNGNRCIEKRIADYLSTGALPDRKSGSGPDVVCEALPKPQPDLIPFGSAAPVAPAPDPEPFMDRTAVDTIVGLLPQRAR